MTYTPIVEGAMIATEFRAVGGSVQNSAVVWDSTTKRSTATTSVSVDGSGNITLPQDGSYWLIANIDITRPSAVTSLKFEWFRGGVALTTEKGASLAVLSSGTSTSNLLAQMVVEAVDEQVVQLKETSGNTQTINSNMSLLILEVSR
ncbi:MAG: hypothetical protein ACO395_02025 [Pontimonas sp.]|jgi:hypothetical protein